MFLRQTGGWFCLFVKGAVSNNPITTTGAQLRVLRQASIQLHVRYVQTMLQRRSHTQHSAVVCMLSSSHRPACTYLPQQVRGGAPQRVDMYKKKYSPGRDWLQGLAE